MAALATTEKETVYLDGHSLDIDTLLKLSTGRCRIDLTKDSWERVAASRKVVDNILAAGEVAYGINTGFGLFSKVVISPEDLHMLQVNLILSHAAGVGEPLPRTRTRMLLALRTNVLSKGFSGISVESLKQVIAAFNADCLSVVPVKGTVGASGDLAPLSHLCLGLLGEGKMWNPVDGTIGEAADIIKAHGLTPMYLKAKEGLAMINGTQLITSLGAEACFRARNVALCADVAAALSLEALKGTPKAYHPCVHAVRPHKGQNSVASRMRMLLTPEAPSEIFQQHRYAGSVQDAYSMRCVPQVHGICNDTIDFVSNIISTEMNSATDNPMVFTGEIEDKALLGNVASPEEGAAPSGRPRSGSENPVDVNQIENLSDAKVEISRLRRMISKSEAPGPSKKRKWGIYKQESDLYYTGKGGFIISAGNFHGEYPAKALDYLAIGVSELAGISERRIERLCNPDLSGLPAFLVKNGGYNSGFMIAHCTAAAMVSENKVLVHPSSCDSLSTSAAKEDHVSMGGFAARKALEVVSNVEVCIAIEILAACQGLEFFLPKKSTAPLDAVYRLVRKVARPWDTDRIMNVDIDAVTEQIRSGEIARAVAPFLEKEEEA